MKHLAFPSAVFSLLAVVYMTSCKQEYTKPAQRPVQLNSLLTSIPRDTFVTVLDTFPSGIARPLRAYPNLHLELAHNTNDVILCFHNGNYIDLEKCLPGMHRGNRHKLKIATTGCDTLTAVNFCTMSYIQFVPDSTFDLLKIDWTADTPQLVHWELFCGTGEEVFECE